MYFSVRQMALFFYATYPTHLENKELIKKHHFAVQINAAAKKLSTYRKGDEYGSWIDNKPPPKSDRHLVSRRTSDETSVMASHRLLRLKTTRTVALMAIDGHTRPATTRGITSSYHNYRQFATLLRS